jgi:flavin-dependent dehydrogenase
MGEGIGPAIRSGQLAAGSILSGIQYSVDSIPHNSFPSLLGHRRAAEAFADRVPPPDGGDATLIFL